MGREREELLIHLCCLALAEERDRIIESSVSEERNFTLDSEFSKNLKVRGEERVNTPTFLFFKNR